MDFILAGCLIVMMGACSSAGLKIDPPLQHYNSAENTTSFICINDGDSFVSADDIEWLYPNFTIITSTLADSRICGTSYRPVLLSLHLYYNIDALIHVIQICYTYNGLYSCMLMHLASKA